MELTGCRRSGIVAFMSENNTPLLPDDEHYYFGVELLCPPEAVREHLLRRPDYLYALTHHEEDEEDYRTWLYLWRGNEGWDLRLGDWSGAEQIAQMCARYNMGLHVVLHALTEDAVLNPTTFSSRQPVSYVLVEPSSAEGSRTIPQLNFRLSTGNTEITRFHVIRSADFAAFFKDSTPEPLVPEEVPQEVIDQHCVAYMRRALAVMKAIHDADSLEPLLPLVNEYSALACNLLPRCAEAHDEYHRIAAQLAMQENGILMSSWYAGCRHQRYTHPSGLLLRATYPPVGEYCLELIDFEPGRKLCCRGGEGAFLILPAGENDEPLPQREGGRIHILPDTCGSGHYRDAQNRIIRWGIV